MAIHKQNNIWTQSYPNTIALTTSELEKRVNQELMKKHGIQERPEERKHLHLYLSAAVINEVDRVVPPRMRSRFFESCVKQELETLKAS